MKTLEQIQEENRKAIIMVNNPAAKDYDEALEMEIEYGCKIYDLTNKFFGVPNSNEMTLISGDFKRDNVGSFLDYRGDPTIKVRFKNLLNKNDYKIIGKPLTLDRVLIGLEALDSVYYEGYGYSYGHIGEFSPEEIGILLCEWDLTRPTLEDQSEETQRIINKLLIK